MSLVAGGVTGGEETDITTGLDAVKQSAER